MARSQSGSILPAILLILILMLTLGAFPCASQPGFQSINCGGEAYNDPNTNITWSGDPFNKSNDVFTHGSVSEVNSSTHVLTTLRFFPNASKNKKFCYSLGPSLDGQTCLLRASFLYGNYDGKNQPPNFVLILNSDVWTNVTTSSSNTPLVHELTFVSNEDVLNICVAPNHSSNHTPFISTLELRILESSMYHHRPNGSLTSGYGLLHWRRINYGAKTQAEIRYPGDKFDRIWEANTTGPTVSTSNISNLGLYYGLDPEMPPAEVMATAITTHNSAGNLSFTYDGFGGTGGFLVEMHFQEVEGGQSLRSIGFEISGSIAKVQPSPGGPITVNLDQRGDFPFPLQFTLFPVAGSPLLNAIELFSWTTQQIPTSGTSQADVVAIEQIQAHFSLIGYGQGEPCMPEEYTWTWIKCNNENPPRITTINLASLNLTGSIPPSISKLTSLQTVDLSNNRLSGQIPDLSVLLELVYLDVSNNNLCGDSSSIPPSINYRNVTGNKGLCDGCNCASSNSSMPPTPILIKTHTTKYIVTISILGALYVASMIVFVAHKARQKAKQKKKRGVGDHKGLTFMSRMFTYDEIKSATRDFTTILGEGGFGKVYHGLLPTGEAIAVKSLADSSKQGLKEFYNEVAILSRVRHKNLVSLIGYCVENTYMLIYEYIAKGNIRDLIYGDVESNDKPLSWTTRLHIAHDASQGLEYLHTGCDPSIIHRDVKSSNILLSEKMQAKVSDFGLSRLKEGDNAITHVSTLNVVGTPGYLDPEYNSTNQLTDRSDVYSFGIVLFELICGRVPIDMFNSPPHIVDWAKQKIIHGKPGDIVDPMLENGYKFQSMWKVIDMAFGCVEHDRTKRPKMAEVAQLLQNALEIELDQNKPFTSQDDSGTSSASNENHCTFHYLESIRMKLEPR